MRNPYIDESYYKDEYEGEPVDHADFSKFAKRASDVVDQLTEFEIYKNGLESYDQFVQGLVKRATAAQVEYYQLEGGIAVDVTGQTESSGNFSLSKFSVNDSSSETSKQANRVAPNLVSYLDATGLLKRKGVRLSVI